jgi:hypothetical protein
MLTEGSLYPPTAHWRELTPTDLATRLKTADDLLNMVQWSRGDPRLTRWEEDFLTGMVRHIQTFHGAAKISPKQWDHIHLILDKLEEDPAEPEED